jgi:hypothetical protein
MVIINHGEPTSRMTLLFVRRNLYLTYCVEITFFVHGQLLKSIAQGWGCKGHDNFAMGSTQRAYAFVTNLFANCFF